MDEHVIAFLHAEEIPGALSDAEFLKSLSCESHASPSFKEAARDGDVTRFCNAVRDALPRGDGKQRGKRVRTSGRYRRHALWSCAEFGCDRRTLALADLWEAVVPPSKRTKKKISARRKARTAVSGSNGKSNGRASTDRAVLSRGWEQIVEWLPDPSSGTAIAPVELLVLMEMIREAGADLPADVLWPIWRTALTAAIELCGPVAAEADAEAPARERLIVSGELPWQAGLLFSHVGKAASLRRAGKRVLRRELLDCTDTDGTPAADLMARLADWLAPLVRAAETADELHVSLWDDECRARFRALVRVVAPLCRPDGLFALSDERSPSAVPLLSSASRLAGWKKKSLPADLLSAVKNGRIKAKKSRSGLNGKGGKSKQLPVVQSDWARLACLRSDWSVESDTLVVAHHDQFPRIYLAAFGRAILNGEWGFRVALDGTPVELNDEWGCTCWYSDRDADYLELTATLDGNVRVERQLLLARRDHFALLADSVAGSAKSRIDYETALPVVDGIDVEPRIDTRECVFRSKKQIARAFPLALPEDRLYSAAGGLEPRDGRLQLKLAAIGGLYAPLVIDWHPERKRTQAEWRTLTVAQEGKTLRSDTASGHRLRIGDQHLLFYRSLKKSTTSRSVLGHHTAHETVIGRFDASGDVDPILLVE